MTTGSGLNWFYIFISSCSVLRYDSDKKLRNTIVKKKKKNGTNSKR